MSARDVHVLLVATHWTPRLENCKRSLHQQGYLTYHLLGWGEKWGGWVWRMTQYVEALRALPSNRLVLLLDAYDMIASRPAAQLVETFRAFNRPVVVGTEWYCGSETSCGRLQDSWWSAAGLSTPVHSKHVNAGCVMGAAGELLRAYEWILATGISDDQLGLASWISFVGPTVVALDFGAAIVQNVHVLDGSIDTSTAFFHHFPGPLLKHGLFPHYNAHARRVLGVYARCVYPCIELDALMCAIFISVVAWVALRYR
jgi:hypothetical protein